MGSITNILKGQANNAMSQIKGMNVENEINSRLKSANIDFQLPDLEVPDSIKNFKLDVSSFKLPAGVDSYISPVVSQLLSGIKLPSEIGGLSLPQLPDLSSISSKVDDYLSGLGLDTSKLGIGDVSDILKEPDLSVLNNISFESPIDLNNMPELTTSLDDFDLSGLQSEIDGMTSQIPEMDSIDISKYF